MQFIQGISPVQTISSQKNSDEVMIRRQLRDVWNRPNAVGKINGHKRAASEFKSVANISDFLSREHYAAGNIPNPSNTTHSNVFWKIGSIIKQIDNTGVACSNSNTRFVPDSSEFTKYRKQRAFNRNYNDYTNSGDQNNGSYVAQMAAFSGEG